MRGVGGGRVRVGDAERDGAGQSLAPSAARAHSPRRAQIGNDSSEGGAHTCGSAISIPAFSFIHALAASCALPPLPPLPLSPRV